MSLPQKWRATVDSNLPEIPRQRKRVIVYEYRLRWQHKGYRSSRMLKSANPYRILKMIRRLCGDEPWTGAMTADVRNVWRALAAKLDVPFDTVKDMDAKAAFKAMQAAYPPIDWLRVEFRQVGEWTAMIQPVETLESGKTDKRDAQLVALFDRVGAMTPAELDSWRKLPLVTSDGTTFRRFQSGEPRVGAPTEGTRVDGGVGDPG